MSKLMILLFDVGIDTDGVLIDVNYFGYENQALLSGLKLPYSFVYYTADYLTPVTSVHDIHLFTKFEKHNY